MKNALSYLSMKYWGRMTIFWRSACFRLAVILVFSPVVLAGFEQQPLSSIVEAVESTSRNEALSRGFENVAVTVQALDPGLKLPLCDQSLSAFPVQADKVTGNVSVGVRCAGQQPWTIYLRAEVLVQRVIPVLVRPLANRSLVGSEDLKLVHVAADTPLNGVILEIDDIVGMELVRSVEAGSPIKLSQVRLPKVIKRGNLVTLLSGGGGFQVKMQGKAQADAAAGDQLRVTNLSSGQVVEGVANADGTVTVY
tara:strand:- start:55436 stop:56191 length:756 start_codon:yes stop_codon:yes gene_type:complete